MLRNFHLVVDACQNAVVFRGNLADFGVGFNRDQSGKIAPLTMSLHIVQEDRQFGTGCVFNDIRPCPLVFLIDVLQPEFIDEPQAEYRLDGHHEGSAQQQPGSVVKLV
jgi:hypothetical protein